MRYPEKADSQRQSRMVVSRAWRRGDGQSASSGDRVSLWEEETVLEVNGGDGGTTM